MRPPLPHPALPVAYYPRPDIILGRCGLYNVVLFELLVLWMAFRPKR